MVKAATKLPYPHETVLTAAILTAAMLTPLPILVSEPSLNLTKPTPKLAPDYSHLQKYGGVDSNLPRRFDRSDRFYLQL